MLQTNVPSRMRYEIQGFLMRQFLECYLGRSCLSSWHSATTAFIVERGEMPRLSMRTGNTKEGDLIGRRGLLSLKKVLDYVQ